MPAKIVVDNTFPIANNKIVKNAKNLFIVRIAIPKIPKIKEPDSKAQTRLKMSPLRNAPRFCSSVN